MSEIMSTFDSVDDILSSGILENLNKTFLTFNFVENYSDSDEFLELSDFFCIFCYNLNSYCDDEEDREEIENDDLNC